VAYLNSAQSIFLLCRGGCAFIGISQFVCLFISWQDCLKKLLHQFSQNLVKGGTWAVEEAVRLWWESGSHYARVRVMVRWGHRHTVLGKVKKSK